MFKFKYLYRCKKCGKRLTRDEEYCSKCKRIHAQPQKSEKSINLKKCLICDENKTNDELYCPSCLKKYILPRKSKNSEYQYEDLDKKYDDGKKHECINGAMVRSKAELIVSSVLEVNGIKHIYEYPLFVKDMPEKNKFIKPDFFLPEIKTKDGKVIKNVFLEHFGWNIHDHSSKKDLKEDKKYESKTNKKLPTYKKMGLTVICTSYEDINDPNESVNDKIMNKILNCEEGKINGVDESMLYPKHFKEFMES